MKRGKQQISDLHNQFFGINQGKLIDEIENCDPDIIVVTGDVVDSGHTCYKFAIDFFEGAVKIAPVYYITGNHEVWLYGEEFNEFLSKVESMGVQFMDGETLLSENMIIAGTENGFSTRDYKWEDDNRLKILLAHEPSKYVDYTNTGADIVFAGLGNSVLPVRINNYPEIVVVNIIKK